MDQYLSLWALTSVDPQPLDKVHKDIAKRFYKHGVDTREALVSSSHARVEKSKLSEMLVRKGLDYTPEDVQLTAPLAFFPLGEISAVDLMDLDGILDFSMDHKTELCLEESYEDKAADPKREQTPTTRRPPVCESLLSGRY